MRAFELIKHVRCTDVAFLIKKVQYRGSNYTKVKGWWVNVVNPNKHHFITYAPENIKISCADLPKWKRTDIKGLL